MKEITPYLWFDKEAKEAAEYYVSTFGNGSKIKSTSTFGDEPTGEGDIVSFEILGHSFVSFSAGLLFKFNPSISFIVNCETRSEIDTLWNNLYEGGTALMPLDRYPFSERYGWIQDKYGISWQLILSNPEGDWRPRIIPCLTFVGNVCGRAEEAINFYVSVFKDAKAGAIFRYGPDQTPEKEGTVMFADFMLNNQWYAAMDSAREHNFSFGEAISLMVNCDTQEEIDYYWEKLSAVPEAEQCGWLKDKFGVSWQITPAILSEMMSKGTKDQVAQVTQAFLKMKKFDVEALKEAYTGVMK